MTTEPATTKSASKPEPAAVTQTSPPAPKKVVRMGPLDAFARIPEGKPISVHLENRPPETVAPPTPPKAETF